MCGRMTTPGIEKSERMVCECTCEGGVNWSVVQHVMPYKSVVGYVWSVVRHVMPAALLGEDTTAGVYAVCSRLYWPMCGLW
mgnify:CR=1 FL=1